jgi:hypothetical protein
MPTTATPMTIEQRLSKLERQNCWLKRILAIPAILLALACLTGAVNQFNDGLEVKGGGIRRGWFGGTSDGGISMSMYGQKGQDIVYVGQNADWSPSIMLYNRRGTLTAELLVDYKTGLPRFSYYDPQGTSRMELEIEDGKPSLGFWNKNGTNRMLLTSQGLSFYDAQGNELPSSVLAY